MRRRGLLLDRDGVVNIDHGYVHRPDQFEFMPGLFPFLRTAIDRGWRLAILTNQAGVARGFYTEQDFHALTAWMLAALAGEGIAVDLVLSCFEHPEGHVAAYARQSFWRKPNPGMVLEAVQNLRLDAAHSVFLGDQPTDMEAASKGGIGTRLLLGKNAPEGATSVRDFSEAAIYL